MRGLRPGWSLPAIALATATALAPIWASDAIPMSWQVERGGDRASVARHCTATTAGRDVTVRLETGGQQSLARWSVRIGAAPQPGSLRYLRVGKRIFQTDHDDFQGAEADEIVARLKEPGVFVFEWFAGPEHIKHGGLFSTGDFALAAHTCEDWVLGRRL